VKSTFRRVAASCLVGLFVSAPVFAATPVEEAQGLMAHGDLDGALKRIDRFLSSSPQDAEGRFTRGLILVKQNKAAEAIKAFTDLTRDYPQLPEPYNNLAVLYAQSGDYEKARDALEAALKTNPAYATAHENLGDIYAALAGAAYNRALALDQGNQATRYKLSLINQVSGPPAAKPVAAATASAAAAPASVTPPASAPAATAPIAGASDASRDVLAALDAWARAWSARDADAYIAAYAADFQPEGGASRADWEALRRSRIGKARQIAVKIVGAEVQSIDAQQARVLFTQDYASDTLADKVSKAVDLRLIDGSWKIVREAVR
jgi:tetratricopeptide (TPR) repeat protein